MQVLLIIMISVLVVVEAKIITIPFLHLNHLLKVHKETAVLKSMSVDRPAGMEVMMETEAVRVWDTALTRYAQEQCAIKDVIVRDVIFFMPRRESI